MKHNDKEFDFQVFSIVKFFQLAMENNPNVVDALFTPVRCVLHSTGIGNHIRLNRERFLHKGLWHKFKGYAYSQLHKMESKNPIGKRKEQIEKFGFDCYLESQTEFLTDNGWKKFDQVTEQDLVACKFAYHVVRLMLEAEQMLTHGTMDLERDRDILKAIRRGDWPKEKIREFFEMKEKHLDELYQKSPLPHGPDEAFIKNLLLECLEMHYGRLTDKEIVLEEKIKQHIRIAIAELQKAL